MRRRTRRPSRRMATRRPIRRRMVKPYTDPVIEKLKSQMSTIDEQQYELQQDALDTVRSFLVEHKEFIGQLNDIAQDPGMGDASDLSFDMAFELVLGQPHTIERFAKALLVKMRKMNSLLDRAEQVGDREEELYEELEREREVGPQLQEDYARGRPYAEARARRPRRLARRRRR